MIEFASTAVQSPVISVASDTQPGQKETYDLAKAEEVLSSYMVMREYTHRENRTKSVKLH